MTRNGVILVFGATLVALALALPGAAEAAPEFTLAVNLAGEGEGEVRCEVEGGLEEPCEAKYPEGTELTLVPVAGEGSEFAGFSAGAGSATGCTGTGPCSFTIAANSSVTATFELEPLPEFALTVKKTGTGTGTVECEVGGLAGPCASSYPEGTELTLIATADSGSEFIHWTGACAFFEESEECELTMEGSRSVTATFNLSPALTVKAAGTGTGTVECEAEEGPGPCAARYPKGTELILYAIPDPGSKFVKWAGCDSVVGSDCEVEMSKAHTVTATFDLEPPVKFKLTVTKSGTGAGTVKGGSVAEPNTINCGSGAGCEHEYLSGAVVTLTHEATAGSEFKEWTGACTGSGTCEVTMSAAKSVGAKFDTQSGGGGGGSGGSGGSGGGGGNGGSVDSGVGDSGGGGGGAVSGTARAAGTAAVSGGRAALELTCSAGTCKGTLQLVARVKRGETTKSVVIGKADFSIAAGAAAMLRVKLSGAAKQELGKGKTLKAKLSGTGIAGSTVEIKPARRKHPLAG